MSWESELDAALVTAITGNSAITDLLVSATAVYKTNPFRKAGYPQITFGYADESDQRKTSDGRRLIALQIDIWGAAGSVDGIRNKLHDLLDDRARIDAGSGASALTMTNYTDKHFRYERGQTIPTGVFDADNDNTEIVQRVTEWSLWLYAKLG